MKSFSNSFWYNKSMDKKKRILAINFGGIGDEIREIIEQYSGYKLPIWLVRK